MKTICCNCLLTCLFPRTSLGPQSLSLGHQNSLSSYCTAGPMRAVGVTIPATHAFLSSRSPAKKRQAPSPTGMQKRHDSRFLTLTEKGTLSPSSASFLSSAPATLTFSDPPPTTLALLQPLPGPSPSHPLGSAQGGSPDLFPILCHFLCHSLSGIILSASWVSISLLDKLPESRAIAPVSLFALPPALCGCHVIGAQ